MQGAGVGCRAQVWGAGCRCGVQGAGVGCRVQVTKMESLKKRDK